MTKKTIRRRNALVAQLTRSGLNLTGRQKLNIGLLRALRAGCPFACLVVVCVALPIPGTGQTVSNHVGLPVIQGEQLNELNTIAYYLFRVSDCRSYECRYAFASVLWNRAAYRARPLTSVVESISGITKAPDWFLSETECQNLTRDQRTNRHHSFVFAERLIRGGFVPLGHWTHYTTKPETWGTEFYKVARFDGVTFGVLPRSKWSD